MKYYRVIPLSQSFDMYGLSYTCSDELVQDLRCGDIVVIPFRTWFDLWVFAGEIMDTRIQVPSELKSIEGKAVDSISLSAQQVQMIDFISTHYIVPIHHSACLYFPKNLKEKISKNTLWKLKIRDYSYNSPEITLSSAQQKVFDTILTDTNKKFLLYWVTGSWKTEVYIKLIEENLKREKQTLLLIPEIILTSQIAQRLETAFWDQIIILHSGISAAKKSQLWIDIYSWNAKIIVGTRSSLFYPYNNLWSIIVDEEHDNSYVSDNAPRYNAVQSAEKMSELYDIPLLLASWTPKVTSMYRWLKGDFTLLQLLEKYN